MTLWCPMGAGPGSTTFRATLVPFASHHLWPFPMSEVSFLVYGTHVSLGPCPLCDDSLGSLFMSHLSDPNIPQA